VRATPDRSLTAANVAPARSAISSGRAARRSPGPLDAGLERNAAIRRTVRDFRHSHDLDQLPAKWTDEVYEEARGEDTPRRGYGFRRLTHRTRIAISRWGIAPLAR
jgi:hypothetical protein